MKPTFETWMKQAEASDVAGIDIRDLPDMPYHDWYEDDLSPKAAAKLAVRNAMSDCPMR